MLSLNLTCTEYAVSKSSVADGTVNEVKLPVSPFANDWVVSYTVTLSTTLLILQNVEKCVWFAYSTIKAAVLIIGCLENVLFVSVSITGVTLAGADTNSDSLTVPVSTLDFDTAYAVQVKFRDNNGLESAYSAAVNFTTPLVDQPEIQTIVPAFNPTINVDAIAMKAGYQHTSSDWQFSPANTFGTIVHQSLGNSTNLNSYTLPGAVNLTANTTNYERIRFNINPT